MSGELMAAWRETVRRRSDAAAVIEADSGRATSLRDLEEQARAWCAAQVPPAEEVTGRPVVFALPNGIEWLRVFVGLQHAGAVPVPLDPGEPEAAQRQIAADLRAGFRWTGTRLEPLAGSRRFRRPAPCLLKLTSGSTGRPRALAFTDAQMLADAAQILQTMGITVRDVNYAVIPLGHSYGLGNLTIPLLARGIALVIGSSALPHAVAGDFARWRPTVFPAVPAIFRGLAMSAVEPAALASLRLAISAVAPLPPEVAQHFALRFKRRIHSFYGSSETGGIAYDRSGVATLAGRSVGRPMSGVRLSPCAGRRLRVCSPAVFTLGNRRRSGRLGCWLPPDRAEVARDGEVRLLGRRGSVVKIAGRRVDLAEVAARLRRLPGVRDLWLGVGAGAEYELGAAVVADRPLDELRAASRRDTAPWKSPKRWVLLPELPLTARGKIDAAALHRIVFG